MLRIYVINGLLFLYSIQDQKLIYEFMKLSINKSILFIQ